jgi:2-polyprenyl-3-methyl-5-hydroxy-6-metoxy-1,4-benzoquinol methylase
MASWCIVSRMASGSSSAYVFKDFAHSSHRLLLQWAGPGQGKVLDAGAAIGYLGAHLAASRRVVVGVDVDPALAREAPRQYAAFHTFDLSNLPVLPEAPFDVVVAGDVLEHVVDPGAALGCLVAQLAPNGKLLLSVPNVAFVLVRLELLFGRFQYRRRGILDGTHLRFFTWHSLRRLLADAGLRVVQMVGVPAPLPLVSSHFGTRPGLWLYDATALAARAWPTLFAYQFVVEVCQ